MDTLPSKDFSDTHVLAAIKFASDIQRFYEIVDLFHIIPLEKTDTAELQTLITRQQRMSQSYLNIVNGDYS